ncbi:hypothetical protein GCM10022221_18210 [Actinocorallia aurea]
MLRGRAVNLAELQALTALLTYLSRDRPAFPLELAAPLLTAGTVTVTAEPHEDSVRLWANGDVLLCDTADEGWQEEAEARLIALQRPADGTGAGS